MTKKEIIEGNKLIADFMKFTPWFDSGEYIGYRELDVDKYSTYQDGWGHRPHACVFSELRFHSSWDWLMPVVEKIESLNFTDSDGEEYSFDVTIRYGDVTIEDEDSTRKNFHIHKHGTDGNKLNAVYEAVIEFIEWYNVNKLK